jgi:hypothetical protein
MHVLPSEKKAEEDREKREEKWFVRQPHCDVIVLALLFRKLSTFLCPDGSSFLTIPPDLRLLKGYGLSLS